MSRGIPTRFAVYGTNETPIPPRNVLLVRDFFFPCQRCGFEYPRKLLSREPITRWLVCENDRDVPTVSDAESRKLTESFYDRLDRLGIRGHLDDGP
jgi:hypothetical protein